MRRRLLLALGTFALLAAAFGLLVLFSGTIDVSATSGHTAPVRWLLAVGMKRSVERHARGIETPPLEEPALIARGMRFFETDCVPCHGAPGVPRADANNHLVPVPPELSTIVGEWRPRELFWIVKHGIKSTGMPAWGPTHRDDEIWSAVAFMRALAGMSAEEYRAATRVGAGGVAADIVDDGRTVALAGPLLQHSAACARCHALNGTGGGGGAFPRIDGQERDYLRDALRSYASGERASGIMTSIVRVLSEKQRDAVADYYAALPRDMGLRAAASAQPELLALGRRLAEAGEPRRAVPPCAECHGADGVQGKPRVPYLAGQYPQYLALQLRLWKSGRRGDDGRAAAMADIARRLGDDEIEAVAAYFATLPDRGSRADR